LEQKEQALLQAFPYLEELRNVEPASAEEEELVRVEEGIDEVKLELVKRGESLTQIRQEVSPNTKKRWYESSQDIVRRRQIVLRNPELQARKLCRVFDTERIPLPGKWENELGVTTWSRAYQNRRGRGRIDKIIHDDRHQQ
jgi:hypothetical protein